MTPDFRQIVQQTSNSDPETGSLLNPHGANMLVLLILLVLVLVGLGRVELPTSRLSDRLAENTARRFAKAHAAIGSPASSLRERNRPQSFRESVKPVFNVENPKAARAELPARHGRGVSSNIRRARRAVVRLLPNSPEIRRASVLSGSAWDRLTPAQQLRAWRFAQ